MEARTHALTRDLPDEVAHILGTFVESTERAFGETLVAVVLYGSAAEGALRPSSDVNVIVVLEAFDGAAADRLREPLAMAHAAVRLRAMFLLRDEIAAAAEDFSQKFADVLRRRRVLYGDDPFAGLAISRRALLTRLNQVLLNLTLRLRAAYVERGVHEEQLTRVIAEVAGPLRTAAASILDLEGAAATVPREALRIIARGLGPSWDGVLSRISDARERRPLAPGVPSETVLSLIELARHLRARVLALGRP